MSSQAICSAGYKRTHENTPGPWCNLEVQHVGIRMTKEKETLDNNTKNLYSLMANTQYNRT